jgi:hypothetical protein
MAMILIQPITSTEQSLVRIAVAFERIAAALEDGRAVSAPPPAQEAKKVQPDR